MYAVRRGQIQLPRRDLRELRCRLLLGLWGRVRFLRRGKVREEHRVDRVRGVRLGALQRRHAGDQLHALPGGPVWARGGALRLPGLPGGELLRLRGPHAAVRAVRRWKLHRHVRKRLLKLPGRVLSIQHRRIELHELPAGELLRGIRTNRSCDVCSWALRPVDNVD